MSKAVEKIKILVFDNDKGKTIVKKVDNGLKSLRNCIGGGYLERLKIPVIDMNDKKCGELVFYGDEEAKLKKFAINTVFPWGWVYGTVIGVRVSKDGDCVSITTEDEKKYVGSSE